MVGVDCFDAPKFTTKYCSCQSSFRPLSVMNVPDRLSQTCPLPQGFEPIEGVNAHGRRAFDRKPTRMTYILSISGFSPPFAMVFWAGLREGLGRCGSA